MFDILSFVQELKNTHSSALKSEETDLAARIIRSTYITRSARNQYTASQTEHMESLIPYSGWH
jgi:hypothetical protein